MEFRKIKLKNEILENYFWKLKHEDRSFEIYILTYENKNKIKWKDGT